MKQSTSVSLSDEILRELDEHAVPGESRSAYIERVLRRHLDAAADRLNAEAADVMEDQAAWLDDRA